MLIESLVNATPPIEEFDLLKEVFMKIKDLTTRLNLHKRGIQDAKSLAFYQNSIEDVPLVEERKFVMDGTISIRERSKAVYNCVLFSDGFMVLEPIQDGEKKYKVKYYCSVEKGSRILKKKQKRNMNTISIALADTKKERKIVLLFGFGSDFEGWNAALDSVFNKPKEDVTNAVEN